MNNPQTATDAIIAPRKSARIQWILGGTLLLITFVWCFLAARMAYYTGDYMIGFYLPILLMPAFGLLLCVISLVAFVIGKWRFALMTFLGVILIVLLMIEGWHIQNWAWNRSIIEYDAANRDAIAKNVALPEFTDETVWGLADDEAVPVLQGFQWYCKHHLASPDGAFRAFSYRGVVHVRIQKIRHGYRGIALVNTPADRERLETDPKLAYERAVGDHWVIWNWGQ